VGENSAGKTTFLAICQIVASILEGYNPNVSFNTPPFSLGAFEQIASYRGGRAGRAREFSIAAEFGDADAPSTVQAVFCSEAGQPTMRSWSFESSEYAVSIERKNGSGLSLRLTTKGKGGESFSRTLRDVPWHRPISLFVLVQPATRDRTSLAKNLDLISTIDNRLRQLRHSFDQSPYAFAPIRTSPRRTYDPASTAPDPEGSHVPMLLAQLASQTDLKQWEDLRGSLDDFGASSGLFEQITVKRKGNKDSDPFQIGVKSMGPVVNLADVGYGVSQVLPLVVDSIQRRRTNTKLFLLQQPEVHLHPRAQAALGTFFARLADKSRSFVIETHSDYLLDRVRMEVRRGNGLRPEDLSILYFERGKEGAHIHSLSVDKNGSIMNAPPGYRDFFLSEEMALLRM